ncbi:MFS transporter [Curtobacterium citreum]|uniref:MFS transporter n=1 Tax=Curtobacterium citreum TaxID=2036 RepID=UPI00254A9008|nr:MFS transporter [Curtobacterium citreum]MDK8172269.1 MFS transporter [Curtobacterium citreum]
MRWGIVALLFLSNAIVFLDRTNLSVALPQIDAEFHIDPTLTGVLLSSFFWVYAVMQLPGGVIVDKINAKIMLASATLFWGIATVLMAFVNGIGTLFGLRILLGIGESTTGPTYAKVTSAWFSQKERSVATAIWDSGNRFGTAAALPGITWLTATYGWRWSFAISGLIAIAFVPIWWFFYNRAVARNVKLHAVDPSTMTDSIATAGNGDGADAVRPTDSRVSWLSLLRLRPMWGLMVGYFCLLFVNYFFITWFPAYLVDDRHFTAQMVGLMGVIPPATAMVADWLGGLTSAYLLRRGTGLSIARKAPIVFGLLCASLIAFVPLIQGAWPVIIFLAIAFGGTTFASSCVWCLPAEVTPVPDRVGSVAGLQNFAGNGAGMIGPIIIGALYGATGSFTAPLVLAGVIVFAGVLVYLFLVGPIRPMRHPAIDPAEQHEYIVH